MQRWLEETLGLPKPSYAHPHITYAIGEGNGQRDELIQWMSALAAGTDPLTVLASGLGVFPDTSSVLYLPVPRNPELAAVYQAIQQALTDAGETVHLYYRPDNWLPHVTLATDVPPAKVATVIEKWPAQLVPPLNLPSQLTGLGLVEKVGKEQVAITHEFPFRGQNELGPNPFELTSRPCQPSDQDFVYRLVEETLRPLISAYFTWDKAMFERNWDSSWRKKVIVLSEGKRVGYVQHDTSPADYLYIGGLFLCPPFHGRGWGKWLLNHMEELAQGRPVRLHVWENNTVVRFYQRHGYRIIETEGHKYLMEKVL
jgi:ribosomal protein S18 acetylase RimI-like enzyme